MNINYPYIVWYYEAEIHKYIDMHSFILSGMYIYTNTIDYKLIFYLLTYIDQGSDPTVDTSNASSMPSSVTPSCVSCAVATFSERYFRMKNDSSVAMQTSSPESDQKI